MILVNFLAYTLAFILIWLGSGLIVSSSSKFSEKLKLSPFAFSFVFLGILTSVPEISVGLQAVADKTPEIFVGNLLGGIPILFLLAIPILAIFGNGINLKHELDHHTLLLNLGVILAPAAVVLDKKVTNLEGIFLVVIYLILIIIIEKRKGILDKDHTKLLDVKYYSYKDILKIFTGIALVFLSSRIIVDQTLYFSQIFSISPFIISLIVVSLGTNLPELSLAVRSVIFGKKDIAMGDYLGSAAANTLLFGLFTILSGGEVLTVNGFLTTFIFISTALAIFFTLSYSKSYISRTSGLIMASIYIIYVVYEFMH